jgi:sec-independent protein translocase protein TatB
MFDIGMSELLIVGIVALIVVGPKDLPGMFRTLGRFTAKIKAMSREFTRAMESAADEAGVNEIKDGLNAAANPKKFGLDKLKDAASDFENWDPMKKDTPKTPTQAVMTEDRVAVAKKISDSAAAKATERKASEAAAEAAESVAPKVAEPKTAAKKPAAKKVPAAKKTPAVKPATTKPKAAKPAAKSTPKKPAAKKSAVSKAAPKTAAAKLAAKKTPPAKTKKETDV